MNHGRIYRMVSILLLIYAVQPAQAKDFPAIAGEYVVQLKSTRTTMSIQALADMLGAPIKQVINREEGLYLVQRPLVETRESAIQTLAENAMIAIAEPNYIYTVVGGATSLPNDTELGRLWGLINTGGTYEGDGGAIKGQMGVDINAKKAWQIETGSRDVVIAVIDTGVNYNNPDLAPNIYTNEAEANGQPGVDDDGNGFVDDIHGYDFAASDADPMDVYGHGTHCSGTIGAAGNNGQGVTGVAWNVRILPVRFLDDNGSGTLANAISSIDYATKMKVNIMSNSWGGGGFSQTLMDAISRSKAAGILFVAAAGNNSNDNDANPEYPASYLVDNVISVAAVDPAGAVADFSNYGKNSVHIAAPGVNILSYSMRGLESWSGTSMATPHVSGVASLLLSQDMSQSYMTLKQRILSSARPLASVRGRVATGMVDAYYALTNSTAPLDPNDPFNWQKDAQSAATVHPYANKHSQEWTFTVPGARRVAIYFSKFETEAGYDKVVIKDKSGAVVGTLSGKLGEAYSPAVDGDTLTVTFTSDDTVNFYGFDIGGIAYQ